MLPTLQVAQHHAYKTLCAMVAVLRGLLLHTCRCGGQSRSVVGVVWCHLIKHIAQICAMAAVLRWSRAICGIRIVLDWHDNQ